MTKCQNDILYLTNFTFLIAIGVIMTSKYLRGKKVIKSTFPPMQHLKRLNKIKNINQLGFFSLDRLCIVTEKKINYENFPGKYLGAIKTDGGRVHQYLLEDYDYQFFQGLGNNRRLMFNPRHFNCIIELIDFVNIVTNGEKYHISQTDFSFFLSKEFFSVDFLFYILWVKGGKVENAILYKDYKHSIINNSKYQSFVIGQKPRRINVYDCDSHNVDKERDEKKMVNNSINLEVSIRTTEALQALGINTLGDFLKPLPIEKVLNGISFIEPSRSHLDPELEKLLYVWGESGATKFMREVYINSSHRNYAYIPKKEVFVLEQTLMKCMMELAYSDFYDFISGHIRIGKNGLQSWKYQTPFLFEGSMKNNLQ